QIALDIDDIHAADAEVQLDFLTARDTDQQIRVGFEPRSVAPDFHLVASTVIPTPVAARAVLADVEIRASASDVGINDTVRRIDDTQRLSIPKWTGLDLQLGCVGAIASDL